MPFSRSATTRRNASSSNGKASRRRDRAEDGQTVRLAFERIMKKSYAASVWPHLTSGGHYIEVFVIHSIHRAVMPRGFDMVRYPQNSHTVKSKEYDDFRHAV